MAEPRVTHGIQSVIAWKAAVRRERRLLVALQRDVAAAEEYADRRKSRGGSVSLAEEQKLSWLRDQLARCEREVKRLEDEMRRIPW